jgi:hypothetical protein
MEATVHQSERKLQHSGRLKSYWTDANSIDVSDNFLYYFEIENSQG